MPPKKRRDAVDHEHFIPPPVLEDYTPPKTIRKAHDDVVRVLEKVAEPVARQNRRKKKLGVVSEPLSPIAEKDDQDDGDGLDSLKRKAGLLPPAVRKLLEKVGKDEITSIKITRTPLSSATKTLLNVISLGAYEKAVKNSPYDEMFHLAIFVNNTYTIDKQSVITFSKSNPIKKTTETFDLPVSKKVSFNELFENGRKKMGDEKFTNYDARTNNCQDFILGLLDGSGLLSGEARSFIKQDADAVWRRMPSLSEKLGQFITDVGAVADRVVEGEGYDEKWVEIGRGMYIPVRMKQEQPRLPMYNAVAKTNHLKNVEEVDNLRTFIIEHLRNEENIDKLVKAGRTDLFRDLTVFFTEHDDVRTMPLDELRSLVSQIRAITEKAGGKIPDDIMKLAEQKYQLKKASEEYERTLPEKEKTQLLPKYETPPKKEKSSSNKSMESWREYWAKACKGKKFESRKAVNDYMKTVAKEYKEKKSKGK